MWAPTLVLLSDHYSMSSTTHWPHLIDSGSLKAYKPPPLAIRQPYISRNDSRISSKEPVQDAGAARPEDTPLNALNAVAEGKDQSQRGSPFFGARHTNVRLQQGSYVHSCTPFVP